MNEVEGKSFAFTGAMGFTRRELRAELESRGGIYHPRVTRSTNYLVVGRILPSQGKGGITNKMRLAETYRSTGSPIETIRSPEFMLLLANLVTVAG